MEVVTDYFVSVTLTSSAGATTVVSTLVESTTTAVESVATGSVLVDLVSQDTRPAITKRENNTFFMFFFLFLIYVKNGLPE